MKVYVTYMYVINGQNRWGSCVLHNLAINLPFTEKDLHLLVERIITHENLPSGYWSINLVYILPLAE